MQVVEIVEPHPPKGVEPLRWIVLTTHAIKTAADAWRIVGWYGWHQYETKPPGPITMHNGLASFRAMAAGWALQVA